MNGKQLANKLRRDLIQIWGQVLAIALVMTAGIALYIITYSVIDSLKLTRDSYYQQYRFADVFVSLKRAPRSVLDQLESIPGVMTLEARVSFGMSLQMADLPEPATGRILSIPDHGNPKLNQLYLKMGRLPDEMNIDEVVIDDAFAEAHHLTIGDKVSVILNGVNRQLMVTGVVMSPEFIYNVAPGAMMPDPLRFGIFWMRQRALEATVGMKGAFNDLLVSLETSASELAVKNEIDAILAIYGGQPAYGRELQISNFFVSNEITQLENMGVFAPFIFLAVAAFLINVVMNRQIQIQREQIGMLKALGYSNRQVGIHYLQMASVVAFAGALMGVTLGIWMGSGLTELYAKFFRFPVLRFEFSPAVALSAVGLCFAAVYSGIFMAIRHAIKLPPSEAMRPEAPKSFKASFLTRHQWIARLSYLSRIILRQLERKPWRALLSITGLSLAISILVLSFYFDDAVNHLLDIQYQHIQREDINLSFVEPVPLSAMHSLKSMRGVLAVEPTRNLPVIISHGRAEKTTSLTAVQGQPELQRLLNDQLQPLNVPAHGLLLSQALADILGVKSGDIVRVQLLEDRRQLLELQVVAISKQWIGLSAHVEINYLHRLIDQQPRMTTASLLIDDIHSDDLFSRLKRVPAVISMNIVSILRQTFIDIMAESMYMTMLTNMLFATFISFGVIYNTARIALSERWRELASLRVLGLSRQEVAYLLFGELSLITLIAIPVGIGTGVWLSWLMTIALDTELFRVPFYIENSTYGYSVLILLASTLLSFYLVWNKLNTIDLVSAQKGVE